MVKPKNIWVSPRPDGSWVVQREGAQRATAVTPDKADADRVEVIIQGRNGQIQQKDSYGNDPNPPRDTEH